MNIVKEELEFSFENILQHKEKKTNNLITTFKIDEGTTHTTVASMKFNSSVDKLLTVTDYATIIGHYEKLTGKPVSEKQKVETFLIMKPIDNSINVLVVVVKEIK